MTRSLSLMAAILFLVGCASPRTITPEELALAMNVANSDKPREELTEFWLQPENIAERCKIRVIDAPDKKTEEIYWDGACEGGYAIGLGRAFTFGEGTTQSTLLEIESPDKPFQVYYMVDYEEERYAFTQLSATLDASFKGRAIDVNSGKNSNDFKSLWADVWEQDNGNSVAKVNNLDSSSTTYLEEKGDLSFYLEVASHAHSNIKRVLYIKHEDELVGFYQIEFWSGERRSFDAKTKEEVVLPDEFIHPFINLHQLMDRKEHSIELMVKAAEEKISAYRNKICSRESSPFNRVNYSRYIEICRPGGELAKYEGRMRHKAHQTARNEAAARQQLIQQEQQRKANQISWSQAFLAFANALGQAGNTLRESSNNYKSSSSQVPQVQMPDYFKSNKQPLYEYIPNPLNNLDTSQTLVRTTKSGSGRTVCVYSSGSTKVLPYGQVLCPQTYP